MKTFRIFSIMLLALLALGSCSTDEVVAPGAALDGAPNVRFTLGGAVKAPASRAVQATIPGEDFESQVDNVLALLYDTHDGFVEAVEARSEGNAQYSLLVEKDGTYLIYFVANADDNLTAKLKAIPAGSKADDADNGLATIIADQAVGKDAPFLMLCQAPECITTQITKTYSVGEVHMIRLAARFDIVNGADGVEVTKVTFKNRAVKSTLSLANEMADDLDGWFETATYTPDAPLVGDKENPTSYKHEIYTYENYSVKDSETLPVVTIEYTEDGKTKTHDVLLIDPSAKDLTPLAVKRNNLYRINLSKAYKLEFNLEVEDWNEGETFEIKDLPLGLEKIDEEEQRQMNEALLVCKLFTPFNVKTLDLTTKQVTFFDELTNEADVESFFDYQDLDKAGLTDPSKPIADQILTDPSKPGEKYRLPTLGELQLLVPVRENAGQPYIYPIDESIDRNLLSAAYLAYVPYPVWSGAKIYSGVVSETVPMKNARKSAQTFPDGNNFTDKTNADTTPTENEKGIRGHSWFKKMKTTEMIGYCNYKGNGLLADAENATGTNPYGPIYAIRFKGTSQFAAYKYEYTSIDGNPTNRCQSIKIKALPKDADITIDDIAGNHTFWETGFIEYTFPAVGIMDNTISDQIEFKGTRSFIVSSSIKTKGCPYVLGGYASAFHITVGNWTNNRFSLRLVNAIELHLHPRRIKNI